MIKWYCDACGKEITERSYDIRIMKHITDNNLGYVQMCEGKMQPVSGVDTTQMLCLPCYNEVMYKLWDNLKIIKERNSNCV